MPYASHRPICSDEAPLEVFYTPDEVALALNVSTDVLRKWRTKGQGPEFVTLPRNSFRYPKEALHTWLAGRRGREIAATVAFTEVPHDQ